MLFLFLNCPARRGETILQTPVSVCLGVELTAGAMEKDYERRPCNKRHSSMGRSVWILFLSRFGAGDIHSHHKYHAQQQQKVVVFIVLAGWVAKKVLTPLCVAVRLWDDKKSG